MHARVQRGELYAESNADSNGRGAVRGVQRSSNKSGHESATYTEPAPCFLRQIKKVVTPSILRRREYF